LKQLRVLSGHEVCKLLEGNGFAFARQKGDHLTYQKKSEDTTYSTQVPLHRELADGTIRSIIRQSGLPRQLFEVD
jgi:predicted RNA binding protein YcfA (HicA-like mRNA interferase family)